MSRTRLHFVSSQRPAAIVARDRLTRRFGQSDVEGAHVVVALGGDGQMLETLRARFSDRLPVYGMHQGTIGFLMNDYAEENLPERIDAAVRVIIHPLEMTAVDLEGRTSQMLAINEVSLLRQTAQTAKIRILVDGRERLAELAADGALVSTPAGSSAYNLSAHGPILPIDANLLALTPISPFRPRRWRGALLRHDARVRFEVLEAERRLVAASADTQEVRDVFSVDVREDRSKPLTLLFDEGRALDERVLQEQFSL